MRKFNILLVDDNKHFLEAFEFTLLDMIGERITKVFKAISGEECLNCIENNTIDVIFMDVDMPVMNGIQTTKIIVDRFRFVNIIAVSFHSDMQIIRNMIEAGARNYITKEDISKENLTRIFDTL